MRLHKTSPTLKPIEDKCRMRRDPFPNLYGYCLLDGETGGLLCTYGVVVCLWHTVTLPKIGQLQPFWEFAETIRNIGCF